MPLVFSIFIENSLFPDFFPAIVFYSPRRIDSDKKNHVTLANSMFHTFMFVFTENVPIGLYRDVWIAAIASSTTSLATRTAAICVRFQGRRVRHNADYVPYAKIRFDL